MQDKAVTFTVAYRLLAAERHGNQLKAIIGSDYSKSLRRGTHPRPDRGQPWHPAAGGRIFFELKPLSENLGAVDYDALVNGRPQKMKGGPKGFSLYRIGDAVAARNTHAAIYDALRLVKDI